MAVAACRAPGAFAVVYEFSLEGTCAPHAAMHFTTASTAAAAFMCTIVPGVLIAAATVVSSDSTAASVPARRPPRLLPPGVVRGVAAPEAAWAATTSPKTRALPWPQPPHG